MDAMLTMVFPNKVTTNYDRVQVAGKAYKESALTQFHKLADQNAEFLIFQDSDFKFGMQQFSASPSPPSSQLNTLAPHIVSRRNHPPQGNHLAYVTTAWMDEIASIRIFRRPSPDGTGEMLCTAMIVEHTDGSIDALGQFGTGMLGEQLLECEQIDGPIAISTKEVPLGLLVECTSAHDELLGSSLLLNAQDQARSGWQSYLLFGGDEMFFWFDDYRALAIRF